MNQLHGVIIERENGHYRASLANLPKVSVEASTRDLALQQLKEAAAKYFMQVEYTFIQVDTPATPSLRPSSPQAVRASIADLNLDVNHEWYQEYLANLAAARVQEQAELAAEAAAL